MRKFEGTQGEWKVNVIGQHWNNKSLTHLEVVFGDDGECVCDTVYNINDAKLIAAAPDLLEQLQNIVSEYESKIRDRYYDSYDGTRTLEELLDVTKDAHSAINKALGGE